MSWKTDTRVSDLDDSTEIEVKCKTCAKHRYELARRLKHEARLGQLFLDELETVLKCQDRRCYGPVRLSITHDDLSQGFVGGLA